MVKMFYEYPCRVKKGSIYIIYIYILVTKFTCPILYCFLIHRLFSKHFIDLKR